MLIELGDDDLQEIQEAAAVDAGDDDMPGSPTKTDPRARRNSSILVGDDPNEISYHPSILRLYAPPQQRQQWGQRQILPRVNWGDLFFDLFYVAAAYNVRL